MTSLSQKMRVTTAAICTVLVLAPNWARDMALARPASAPDAGVARPRSAAAAESAYADGVYTATGEYGSLPSSITVTVTLADGIVTAVGVAPHATNPTSLDLQRRFAAEAPALVVGKRIDAVNVGRLAGSSGTPDGSTRRSGGSGSRP